MTSGTLTPLQLTAAAGLLNGQGITGLPTALQNALTNINATTLYVNYTTAVTNYVGQSFATQSTLNSLLSIGQSNCPALGNSIPAAYTNLAFTGSSPYGFSGLIQQTGNAYLGYSGNTGKFCQGFIAVQGYIQNINQFINSAVNAQTYLGPTFTNMDALITNNISEINPEFDKFATDLFQQGQLWNPANMTYYGTPAGLLQQLSTVGRFSGGFFGNLQTALQNQGLTSINIQQLIQGQGELTNTQFNRLQQLAYNAMTLVTGETLQQVLVILDCTLSNINNMAELLNPVKTFPQSYPYLNVPVGNSWQSIYSPGLSVNLAIAPAVNAVLPTASGCDELAKIIPPDQAVANKAIQIALQQITGLPLTTFPKLAQTIRGLTSRIWNTNLSYLTNDVVAWGLGVPTNYRAQQDVPPGIDITNTAYWLPTDLGGISTLSNLSLVQNQTAPITSTVANYFATSQATGLGPNGTVTTFDVVGLAIDYNNFATRLNTARTNIDILQTGGALAALNTAYFNIASAVNDAAVLAEISNANAAITTIVGNPTYASQISALNVAWNYMGNSLNTEKQYQTDGGIDYFNLQNNSQTSVMSFTQLLPRYGLQTDSYGACEFLNAVSDQTTSGGQAIIGSMREGQNNQRLRNAQLYLDINPSNEPAITPVPAVTPVY